MTKITTKSTKTQMPVMVKKRLLAAASSALTLVFFFGLLIFLLAMILYLVWQMKNLSGYLTRDHFYVRVKIVGAGQIDKFC